MGTLGNASRDSVASSSAAACPACGSRGELVRCRGGCERDFHADCLRPPASSDGERSCAECAEELEEDPAVAERDARLLHEEAASEAEDEERFARALDALHRGPLGADPPPLPPRGPAGRPLSLYRLYRAVAARGGIDAALPAGPGLRRAARAVGRAMGCGEWAGTAAGAAALRAAALRHLAPLEREGRGEAPAALAAWWRAEGLPAAAAAHAAAREAAAPPPPPPRPAPAPAPKPKEAGTKRGAEGGPGGDRRRPRPAPPIRADVELEMRRRVLLALETDLPREVDWALHALILATFEGGTRGRPEAPLAAWGPPPPHPQNAPGAHLLDAVLRHMPAPPPRAGGGPRPACAAAVPADVDLDAVLNLRPPAAAAREERAAKVALVLRNLAYGPAENRPLMAHHAGTLHCLATLLDGRYGPEPQRDALEAVAQLAPALDLAAGPLAPFARPLFRALAAALAGGPLPGAEPALEAPLRRRGGERAAATAACEALARLAAGGRHGEALLGEVPPAALDRAVALLHEGPGEARDAALALLSALAAWGPAARAALAARRALVPRLLALATAGCDAALALAAPQPPAAAEAARRAAALLAALCGPGPQGAPSTAAALVRKQALALARRQGPLLVAACAGTDGALAGLAQALLLAAERPQFADGGEGGARRPEAARP